MGLAASSIGEASCVYTLLLAHVGSLILRPSLFSPQARLVSLYYDTKRFQEALLLGECVSQRSIGKVFVCHCF